MTFESLLDRPIAFHRCFVTLTGSIPAALMLSQAIYWSKRTTKGSAWFYKTQKDWEEETGLSRTEQDSARRRLRELGFWFEDRRDVPAKLYFRVDAQKLQSSLQESCNLDEAKPAAKMGQNPQSLRLTETTTHKTTEREELADWIPISLWCDYRNMRDKMKRPLTPGAVDILIEDLQELRDAGEDVAEVMRQAISGGWYTFKAVRKEGGNGKQRESFDEQRRRKAAAAICEVDERLKAVVREMDRSLPDARGNKAPDRDVH